MKFIAALLLIPFTILLTGHQPRLSADELLFASGHWTGSLTYIDYGTKKPYTMPANLDISVPATFPGTVILLNQYPDEPKANSYDTLRISKGGQYFDEGKILEKKNTDKKLIILTEREGMDDNRPATIRIHYTAGPHDFIIYKEVRFNKQDSFMMRHEYRMSR